MKCQAKNRRFFKKDRKKVKNRGLKGETALPFPLLFAPAVPFGHDRTKASRCFLGPVCGPFTTANRRLRSAAPREQSPRKNTPQSAKRGRHRSRCRRVFFEGCDKCRVESRATFARRTPPQGLGAFTHHGLSGLSPVTHICGPYLHCATALYA